jgi:hypothetical protein
MKHLTDEERLACVEGHASKEAKDHVAQCAECAAELESWRRSIQRLENFDWPGRIPRRASILAPVFKWAIAASVVLCIGFGLGRFTGPSAAQIEARVKADVTRDVQQQLLAATRNQQKAAIDSTAILALLNQLRDQQAANYISLRKDLETLASTADSRLNSNSRQIRELVASFSDSNP